MHEAATGDLRRRHEVRGCYASRRRHPVWQRGRLLGAAACARLGIGGRCGRVNLRGEFCLDDVASRSVAPVPRRLRRRWCSATPGSSSIGTARWTAFGGSIGTVSRTSSTVDGDMVGELTCPSTSTRDSVVALAGTSVRTNQLEQGSASVEPTPTVPTSGTHGSWKLETSAQGAERSATPTSLLDVAAENTYLEVLDEELASLAPTSGVSVQPPAEGDTSGSPTIAISVPPPATGRRREPSLSARRHRTRPRRGRDLSGPDASACGALADHADRPTLCPGGSLDHHVGARRRRRPRVLRRCAAGPWCESEHHAR